MGYIPRMLITMQEPTQPMRAEAASAGFYSSPGWNKVYPRIQLLTVRELLAGKGIDYPPANVTFKKAPKATGEQAETLPLPWADSASEHPRRGSKPLV